MTNGPAIYDKAMHGARQYWRERLPSMSFARHIALDHPRPKDGPPRLVSVALDLDDDVSARLRRITGGNPFLLYAAWLLVLQICSSKYSGDDAVTIFSPSTGDAAGNLLPIGATLDGEASFKDALLTTKGLLTAAYQYQQYPFSRMLLDIADDRRPLHLPIIAAMTGFNDRLPAAAADLVLVFDERGAAADFRFDNRIYEESTVRQFFAACAALLRHGLSDMRVRLADIRCGDRERASAAAPAPAPGARIEQLFEMQARRHPQRVAVVDGCCSTSYEALDGHAAQLASVLRSLALDERRPIAIVMDAGTEMVVSMLAAMKLGGSFAPIKLLSITGALADILETLDCQCLLFQRANLAHLQASAGSAAAYGVTVDLSSSAETATLDITRQWGEPAPTPPADLDTSRSAIACVAIDESGGRVSSHAVTHSELVGVFQWLNERCAIGIDDRTMLSPGLGAAAQLYDTLGMLIAGASVEIAPTSSLTDSARLAERLARAAATIWDLPTSLAQNLLPDLLAMRSGDARVQAPRHILLCGEKQCARLAQTLAEWFPGVQVTGLYAPPSTAIWSTAFSFVRPAASRGSGVIAHAIPGFEHAVLNKAQRPAPYSTTGHLHVTRQLAATDAAASEPACLTATGIRAAALDGSRMNWLRGDRHRFIKYECCVELTDLEAVLCRHDQIRAAEVINIAAESGGDGVVAAFVLASPEQLSSEAVRDYLLLQSDVDLVPDRIVVVREFPLTAEGAIDQNALEALVRGSRATAEDGSTAEVEAIHAQLKTIWLEILQVPDVDDEESFFARGGNSLKATLLIARIRDEFGVDLSVQNFFRKPSTRAVAQLVAAESKNGTSRQLPDFKIVPREKYRVQLSTMPS